MAVFDSQGNVVGVSVLDNDNNVVVSSLMDIEPLESIDKPLVLNGVDIQLDDIFINLGCFPK